MPKKITSKSKPPEDISAGLEVLRDYANFPHKQVDVHEQHRRFRVVVTHRDQFGNITGTTEQIEETEVFERDGLWAN
ncbi:hypothetical protein [Subtercola sp. RTI3]|uniref:hypothetical protein n=1 Tax=Subtercola sp. RTI3 TaxID=3048639 RepID=UPI002B235751|nr:hypothetical protein [Subtercola sp. RTI3]